MDKGGEVTLLPVDNPPEDLVHCLGDFKDDFVYAGIIYGKDRVLDHWRPQLPSESQSIRKKDIPTGTEAILLGLSRDADSLKAAIDSIIAGKKTKDDSIFWIVYYSRPQK